MCDRSLVDACLSVHPLTMRHHPPGVLHVPSAAEQEEPTHPLSSSSPSSGLPARRASVALWDEVVLLAGRCMGITSPMCVPAGRGLPWPP
jgi:hypothetical protein